MSRTKRRRRLAEHWRRLRRSKTALFGLVTAAVFCGASLFGPYLVPPEGEVAGGRPFEAPSWTHPVGTNDVGADILRELVLASRVSLVVGVSAAALVVTIGTCVGLVSGFFGSLVDEVLMRLTDIVLILPRLPLMIILAAYLGPSLWTIVIVYSLVGWASLARQVRSQVLSLRESPFVEASRSIGAGKTSIIVEHVLPNLSGLIVANGVMEVMFAILTEAGLSFLGLGDPTHESWGVMLYFAQIRGAFLRGAWWWIVPPGACIALLACAFNFMGTALSELVGPRLQTG